MMTLSEWIGALKHIALKRATFYDNSFPGNCGLVHANSVLSFDCIGLVKSVINDPSIATRTSPVGYYVRPGQVIPDTTEIGILNLCTKQQWSFSGLNKGEYLYMSGHAGVFVGEFNDGGTVNTIECTTDWGANGVTTSYTDQNSGRRFDHKGGTEMRSWEAHGKLTQYIDYSPEKLKVDGVWGKKTTAFAQQVYGIEKQPGKVPHQNKSYKKKAPGCSEDSWKFDGTKGWSWLIAAIQIDVGIILPPSHRKYGKFSATTRKYLQRRIGVKADGIFGPESVKAFQKYLNKK